MPTRPRSGASHDPPSRCAACAPAAAQLPLPRRLHSSAGNARRRPHRCRPRVGGPRWLHITPHHAAGALPCRAFSNSPSPPPPPRHARAQVVILYVDEEESVRRQMRRAQLAAMHNKRVMDAGTGDVWDVRTTDVNEALCRRRYQVGWGRWGWGRSIRRGGSRNAQAPDLAHLGRDLGRRGSGWWQASQSTRRPANTLPPHAPSPSLGLDAPPHTHPSHAPSPALGLDAPHTHPHPHPRRCSRRTTTPSCASSPSSPSP